MTLGLSIYGYEGNTEVNLQGSDSRKRVCLENYVKQI